MYELCTHDLTLVEKVTYSNNDLPGLEDMTATSTSATAAI